MKNSQKSFGGASIIIGVVIVTVLIIFIVLILIRSLGNPFTTVASHIGTNKSSLSTLSVSDDGQLLGAIYRSDGNNSNGEIMLKIMNSAGEALYDISLGAGINQATVNNRITFSPDDKFAAFVLNEDPINNLISSLRIVDIDNKKIINLSDKDKLGELAYTYSSNKGPVWYDNDTLIYEHRINNSPEELVFVDWRTGREVRPRMGFSYTPTLSHDKKTLAFTKTSSGGLDLMLLDLATSSRFASKPIINKFTAYEYISGLAWSPDDRYIAFSYQDDESSRDQISPIIVYSVETGEPIYKMYEWLTEPQWINSSTIMAGYYESNPFRGQRTGSFSKMVFFDTQNKIMLSAYLNALRPNFVVSPESCNSKGQCSGKITTIDGGSLVSADSSRILSRKPIDNLRDSALAVWRKIWLWTNNIQDSTIRDNSETSLDVNKWIPYYDREHGIFFKHPADWDISDASGPGYFNANLGKGTDGIDITLLGLQGDSFDRNSFEKTIVSFARSTRDAPGQISGFEKITIGDSEFYRIKNAGVNLRGGIYNFTYYLNKPVPTWPWDKSILAFTVNSYVGSKTDSDQNGDYNPSVQVLKSLFSTLELRKKPVDIISKSGRSITDIYQPTIKLPLGNIWGENNKIYVELVNRGQNWQAAVDNNSVRPIQNESIIELGVGQKLALYDNDKNTKIVFSPRIDANNYALLTESTE